MKKYFFLFLSVLFLASCDKDSNDDPKGTSELLSENLWELVQFTDENNVKINNSQLTTEALFLEIMYFEFKNDQETRAIDKVSKEILNRGSWNLNDDKTTMDIKVTGFDGEFEIVSISKTKLVLQAPTDNFLSNVGERINLEFQAVIN